MPRQSKAEKLADKRIDVAYRTTCANVQIDVFDISKIFAHGRKLIAEGATDEALAEGIRAFVETIRRN